MKTSARGVAAIALHEGVVTKAYRDVVGVWTIGVGHTEAAGPPKPVAGMTITRSEALAILARDLPKYEAAVNAVLPNVPQHVFDGAVSFCFNCGPGAVKSASWPKLYKAGKTASAESSLKSWNKAGGRVVAGLVNRRKAEADLIFRGQYPAGAAAIDVTPTTAPRYDDASTIRGYQAALAALGFDPGPVDGVSGPKTRAALVSYQRVNGLVPDGIYGPATKAALDRATAVLRGETPAADPAPQGEEIKSAAPAAVATGTAAAAGVAVVAAANGGGWGLAGFLALAAIVAVGIVFVVLRKR